MKKLICYSYPTSDNAKKANLYSHGCYSVELTNADSPPTFLKGFKTFEEAKTFAATLPYPSSKFCLTTDNFHPHTSKAYQQFLAK